MDINGPARQAVSGALPADSFDQHHWDFPGDIRAFDRAGKDGALVRAGELLTIKDRRCDFESILGDLPNPDFGDTLRSIYEIRR
jgi:hypothetical protein